MDLYIRGPEDPNYEDDVIESTDELSILLAQLKMILFTSNYEILGEFGLGSNLDDLVWQLNLNETEITNVLRNQIIRYCPMSEKFSIELEVVFFPGTIQDIALIDIIIDGQRLLGALLK